jgi:chaperonin cofactor prefoldin
MGERFNVDIITSTGKEPTTKDLLKVIIVRLDSVETRLTRLESDMAEVKSRLTSLESDMSNVKATLIEHTAILKRNNLH